MDEDADAAGPPAKRRSRREVEEEAAAAASWEELWREAERAQMPGAAVIPTVKSGTADFVKELSDAGARVEQARDGSIRVDLSGLEHRYLLLRAPNVGKGDYDTLEALKYSETLTVALDPAIPPQDQVTGIVGDGIVPTAETIARLEARLADLELSPRGRSALPALAAIAFRHELVLQLDEEIEELVGLSRSSGATWAQIGKASGVAPQTAHERWRDRVGG